MNNCIATTYKLDNSSAGKVTTLQVGWLLKHVTKQCFQPQSNSNSGGGGGGVVEAEGKRRNKEVLHMNSQLCYGYIYRCTLAYLVMVFLFYEPRNAQYFMLTLFLLITLLHISLFKHHNQGVTLYTKVTKYIKEISTHIYIYIYRCHNKIKHQMVLYSKLLTILKVFLNCNQCAINALYTIISTWICVPWGPNPWLWTFLLEGMLDTLHTISRLITLSIFTT